MVGGGRGGGGVGGHIIARLQYMFWPDVLHVHTLHGAQGALGAQGSQGGHGDRMSTHCVHGGHVARGAYEYPWYLWVSMLFLGVHGTCDLLEFPIALGPMVSTVPIMVPMSVHGHHVYYSVHNVRGTHGVNECPRCLSVGAPGTLVVCICSCCWCVPLVSVGGPGTLGVGLASVCAHCVHGV